MNEQQRKLQQKQALLKTIERKINELTDMQKKKVKFQHMQGLKEEIHRLKRSYKTLNK